MNWNNFASIIVVSTLIFWQTVIICFSQSLLFPFTVRLFYSYWQLFFAIALVSVDLFLNKVILNENSK